MVTIRLSRQGRKKDPFYRVVATDSKIKNSGQALSVLGFWYPKKDEFTIDKKEVKSWVDKGAKISPAVQKLLK